MNELKESAVKLKYTPKDPKVLSSVATYTDERTFKTAQRSISAAENVRAGRNAGNTGKRFYYYTRLVSFNLGDRIRHNGLLYDIVYIPDSSVNLAINYVDTKALQ